MKNKNENCIQQLCRGKTVVFITTKNIDYIRNSQEINYISKSATTLKVVGYGDKSYILRIIKIYFKLLFMSFKAYEVIFVGFAPQLILPIFSFKFNKKLIVEDFFISMYDTMIFDRKKFKQNGLIAKTLLKIDKKTIKLADKIIVDTHAHGEYFVNELFAERNKINVLYLEADKKIYYPKEISKSKEFSNKFVVLYFGSILPLQGIDVILKCAELMEDEEDIIFEIIGPISDSRMKKYKSLKNINFTLWLSQEKLAEKIGNSDLCLAGHFNKIIDKASRTIPGKAYIYNAMKKPMILGDNPANREVFKEDNKKYYYVEMGNSNALREKILCVKANKEGAIINEK